MVFLCWITVAVPLGWCVVTQHWAVCNMFTFRSRSSTLGVEHDVHWGWSMMQRLAALMCLSCHERVMECAALTVPCAFPLTMETVSVVESTDRHPGKHVCAPGRWPCTDLPCIHYTQARMWRIFSESLTHCICSKRPSCPRPTVPLSTLA